MIKVILKTSKNIKKIITESDLSIDSVKDNDENVDLIIFEINKFTTLDDLNKIPNKNKIQKIILTDSFDEKEYVDNNFNLEKIDYLIKPINERELFQKLNLYKKIKKLEDKIKENSDVALQYKHIVDYKTIISKTNIEGLITYINKPFIEITGYKEDELLGESHNIIRHPETSIEVFEELWNTIKVKKKVWQGRIKNRKKNGESYYVDSVIQPILDKNNDIIEFIAMRHDITEVEEAKKILEKQNVSHLKDVKDAIYNVQQYEKAINNSNIVSKTDIKGNITYVNELFCELSGYEYDELIGQPHSIIKHEDTPSSTFKELWETITKGKVWKGRIKNKTKSGNPYYVNATMLPITNRKGKIIEYLSIRHDITEIMSLHNELEDTQREIIYRMGEIGETRSKETGNHVKRVAEYSKLLAQLYGLSKEDTEILFIASPMHDIGKVGIPDAILNKPGKLSSDEWSKMREHSVIGYNILKSSKREIIKTAATISLSHHEKWDGKGYPNNLKEEEIHIFGRITAIADVFDALGSNRCYKQKWEDEKILQLFENQKGKHFEPKLVDLFLDNIDSFFDIRNRLVD